MTSHRERDGAITNRRDGHAVAEIAGGVDHLGHAKVSIWNLGVRSVPEKYLFVLLDNGFEFWVVPSETR